ncbi:hypothetical protein C8Q80DRAFT_347961 [Daedaleopsis nitida]|nr:hypothetical protein C8Q80DRAFT_347961 [Daedaleopsis nitida]
MINRHSRARWHNLSFLLPVLGAATTARASPSNRTIDDQDGDSATGDKPTYAPSNGWAQGSQCSGCNVQLDRNEVFHGTWSDTTVAADGKSPRNITINFTGTAMYVYNAVANTIPGTRTDQDITFLIDGAEVGSYVHAATSSTDTDYRVLVFSKDQLQNVPHTLLIRPNPNSNILFDYAMYTFDDSVSSTTTDGNPTGTGTSESTSTGAPSKSSAVKTAVPAAVASVVGVALIVALIFFLRRRRRRRSGPRVILDPDMESSHIEKRYENNRHDPHVPREPTDGGGPNSALLTADGYPGGSNPSEYGSGSGPSELGSAAAFHDASSPRFSLAPLPPSHFAQRHHQAEPASPPPTSVIQSELAALRDEVSRLRQDQQAGASSSAGAAPARAPRGEKSTYSPVVLSPEGAQQNELAALREEVMRLRQDQAHGHLLDDSEAPPEYEVEVHR